MRNPVIRLLAAAAIILPLRSLAAQGPPADTAGKYVTVFGAKIFYQDRGAGSPVILVHGLGDDVSVWAQSIGPLSKTHRVIALDLIGYGRSDKPLLDYRPETFSDFLGGFIAALHIERPSLVGNSLGGFVVALYAVEHPAAVDRLVIVDGAGFASYGKEIDPRMAAALHLSARDDYRYLSPFTFYDTKKFFPTDAFLDYAMSERVKRGDGYTVSKTMESLMRKDDDLEGRLGAITSPTLIVWGRGDRLIPLKYGQRFNREIKRSRLQVIEKCGHIPQVECPAELNALLLDFLTPTASTSK